MSDLPPPGWGDEPRQPPPPPSGSPPPYGQPPPPYGSPPYGYGYGGYAPETESMAIVALVLAIASFVVCPVVPAVIALILASSADGAIESSGGRKTGRSLTMAARVVAWINLGLAAAFLLVVVVAATAAGIAGS